MATAENLSSIKLTTKQLNQLKVKRHFEILIEEANWDRCDEHGNPEWRRVNMGHEAGKPVIITVSSPQELNDLQAQYKAADQRFRITREVDPPSNEDLVKLAIEQGILSADEVESTQTAIDADGEVNAVKPEKDNSQTVPCSNVSSSPKKIQPVQKDVVPEKLSKPKIVTIGDIQVKYDGDKVYQRQWIRLSANEAANFRVVNDQTNKIVVLNGKHIEAKKWVLVEEDPDTEEMTTEELIDE